MISTRKINSSPEEIISRLKIRQFDANEIVHSIISLDQQRKTIQLQLDSNLSEQNQIAKKIGAYLKQGEKTEVEKYKIQNTELKKQAAELNQQQQNITELLHTELCRLPNLPHSSVPAGKSAEDNEIVKQHGEIPNLTSGALPHWDLGKKYEIFDLDLGTKLTGAGFPVYKGNGARLQRALISFFLDCNINAGYKEILPPLMVNAESAFATGQLPDKDGQMYHCQTDNLYLIPTAEVPVTNLYRNHIFQESELPVLLTAYTPCFRREAGSYGKDVRGLNRVHQFDKVEIVRFELPENSYQALELMVEHVETILQKLNLPYRIVRLCGGDMGFASALTYDFEVFSAVQKRWLEVSSVSNFEDFQANRLKARYKTEDKKTASLHTLNGSALALPRIVATLLENNQTDKGIIIPEVLIPYTSFPILNNNQ